MRDPTLLPNGGLAVVIGSGGAIGGAIASRLRDDPRFAEGIGLARRAGDASAPPLDLLDEASIATAVQQVAGHGFDLRLLFDATGLLHDEALQPEKTWRHLDPKRLARSFAVNAIGPALLMKHFLPLLPRSCWPSWTG